MDWPIFLKIFPVTWALILGHYKSASYFSISWDFFGDSTWQVDGYHQVSGLSLVVKLNVSCGFHKMQHFIFLCLGSNLSSVTGGIFLFYVIFYSLLAIFFAICMKILLSTLNIHYPRLQLQESIIGTNPGKNLFQSYTQ